MEALACGEVGLSPTVFYRLTPRQFCNIVAGFRKKHDDAYKDQWERLRWGMWASLKPHERRGSNLTPAKLMPFPWEKTEAEELGDLQALEIKNNIEGSLPFWDRVNKMRAKAAEKVTNLFN